MEEANNSWGWGSPTPQPPEIPWHQMEFLARSWSISAMEVSKKLASRKSSTSFPLCDGSIPEDETAASMDLEESSVAATANSFSSATSQLIMDRIMGQTVEQQDASPMTSGRRSQRSDTPTGSRSGGSLSDGSPAFPSLPEDPAKFPAAAFCLTNQTSRGGVNSVNRWLKDRKEKKKEETRAHNAQVHAAVSVAALAAAVAAMVSSAAAGASAKDNGAAKMDVAVASAATVVAAHCVEVAETIGAERELLASVVGSAVNSRTPGDVVALTAAAATALRGSATLKARALKEVWNVAAVVPLDKGSRTPHGGRHEQQSLRQAITDDSKKDHSFSSELLPAEFLGICRQELLAQGTELLKRTRKGALHWKTVSVYINSSGKVVLKMKSKYAVGTITKKKKYVVTKVCKDVVAWPGRHLLEGGEQRRYFGLKTTERRVIEFECRSQRDYEIWTQGVVCLLDLTVGRSSTKLQDNSKLMHARVP